MVKCFVAKNNLQFKNLIEKIFKKRLIFVDNFSDLL